MTSFKESIIKLKNWLAYIYYSSTIKDKFFEFNGNKIKYFIHLYNYTFTNERIIEIPIIDYLLNNKNAKILEVGNVIQNYMSFEHDIVDKYEIANNVKNIDIMDYNPKIKYDYIISISTIEHVGFDESPQDLNKAKKTIIKLKKLLTKKWKINYNYSYWI